MSFLKRPSNDKAELRVIARAPFHRYYEGSAQVISAANAIGKFDILPNHADFFSMLIPGKVTIIVTADVEPIVLDVTNGIITVRDNEVMLFVNM